MSRYRIVYVAGPYTVRHKAGERGRRTCGAFYWIEGPGMPDTAPTTPHEASERLGDYGVPPGGASLRRSADALARAYEAGRNSTREGRGRKP